MVLGGLCTLHPYRLEHPFHETFGGKELGCDVLSLDGGSFHSNQSKPSSPWFAVCNGHVVGRTFSRSGSPVEEKNRSLGVGEYRPNADTLLKTLIALCRPRRLTL